MDIFGYHCLLIYNVDLSAWCKRYGLQVFKGVCADCEKSLTANIPFAAKGVRGLVAQRCPKCGSNNVPFSFTKLNDQLFEFNDLLRW